MTGPSGSMPPVPRVGARLILLDDDDRVLLIEERFESPRERWRHWLTPGGGVEAGESLAAAATREVVEETGIRIELPPDAAEVHRQRRAWSWAGVTYDQVDHYFAARVAAPFEPVPAALTEIELQTVVGARWWRAADIRASSEVFVPPDLADVVDALVAPGAAALPRPIGRRAGRVLVFDPDGCVLLILIRPETGDTGMHWITPGGGVDPGETTAEAAWRELAEETGIQAGGPREAEPVLVERAVFRFGDVLLDQTDEYYVHHVATRPEIVDAGLSEGERRVIVEYRWWSAAELAASAETFWPAGLAAALAGLAGRSPYPA